MIEFGAFRYDPDSQLLYRGDEEIVLSGRVVAVLESLLKRPAEILLKEEILASAWGETFIGEGSLPQAISELRQILGDDARNPTYIQTIPRRGYRLIVEVSEALGNARVNTPEPSIGNGGMRIAVAASSIIVVGLAWQVPARWTLVAEAGDDPRVTTRRVAATAARETDPSISPDGQWVVYAMEGVGDRPPGVAYVAGAERLPNDLFLQDIEGHRPFNLTETPDATELQPAFSPDGGLIAFRRTGAAEQSGIWVMNRDGQWQRRLSPAGFFPAWTADGAEIYFTTHDNLSPYSVGRGGQLHAVDVETGVARLVFDPDGGAALQPKPSPNGHRVAFWGSDADGVRDIFTIPAAGGEAVAVTRDRALDWNPIWSPDGRYLYFSSSRGGSMNIWRVAVDEASGEVLGEPEPLTSGGDSEQGGLSISSDGRRLLYREELFRTGVYRASYDGATATIHDDGQPITRTSLHALHFNVSDDGKRLAFVGGRDRQDIWVVNVDGTGERMVTDDHYTDWRPRWSGDSETLFFQSNRNGAYGIWRIRADGGSPTLVIDEPAALNFVPSPDGRFLAYEVGTAGYSAIATLGEDGSVESTSVLPPVPDEGGWLSIGDWSPDGEWIVGTRSGVVLYQPKSQTFKRLTDEGAATHFSQDGKQVQYRVDAEHWLVEIGTLERRKITTPRRMHVHWLLPEHAFYRSGPPITADIWLLEIDEAR